MVLVNKKISIINLCWADSENLYAFAFYFFLKLFGLNMVEENFIKIKIKRFIVWRIFHKQFGTLAKKTRNSISYTIFFSFESEEHAIGF